MPTKILVVGLDAAEADRLLAGVADGRLPTLALLAEQGTTRRVTNAMDFLPGTIWPELHTGRSGWRDGLICHVGQLRAGEQRIRDIRADEINPAHAWFNVAAASGKRVLVIDAVQMLADVGEEGVSVDQWLLHDRNWDLRVHPPGMAEIIEPYRSAAPRPDCDSHHGRLVEGYESLLAALEASLRAKRDLAVELLADDWDVAFVTFSESHCAGHQLWHFLDPDSPFHDANAPEALRKAVDTVYAGLDEALGALWAAAGDDALVFAMASHGMRWEVGGPAALEQALHRLGYGSAEPPLMSFRRRVPRFVRRLARAVIPRRAVRALGGDSIGFERPRVRALAVPNNRCGAVRLRVRGRDSGGLIEPDDVDATVARMREELAQLRTVDGDEPIVAATITPAEAFGPDAHPDLPDLMIDFRRDIGPLDRVHSPATGVIEVPLIFEWLPRTGDHTAHTQIWLAGPGADDVDLAGASAVDLAPTLLDLMQVPVPAGVDGASRGTRHSRLS